MSHKCNKETKNFHYAFIHSCIHSNTKLTLPGLHKHQDQRYPQHSL